MKPDKYYKDSISKSVVFYSENRTKKKRVIRRYFTVAFVLFLLLFGVLFGYVSGFIPVTALMETKEPAGNFEELGIGSFARYYPKIANDPVLDKFKYKIYGTDASQSEVIEDYDERLSSEGYSLEYKDDERINGFRLRSYGYVKGLTGVGIIVLTNVRLFFGHRTVVFYSTGSVFDYMDLLDEYGGISGFLS